MAPAPQGSGSQDLYAILEVERGADEATIKKSYRRLVLKYHPDKNPEDVDASREKMIELNRAYETLGNSERREAYQQQLAVRERHFSRFGSCGVSEPGAGPHLSAARAAAAPMQSAAARGGMAPSTALQPRHEVTPLPGTFVLSPLGFPDRFLRHGQGHAGGAGMAPVFQAREDVGDVGFEDFFIAAKFSIGWLPDFINPDKALRSYSAKLIESKVINYGCGFRLLSQPGLGTCMSGGTGVLITTDEPEAIVKRRKMAALSGLVFSHGISPDLGDRAPEIKFITMQAARGQGCDMILRASPDFHGAVRFESLYYPGNFLAFMPPGKAIMTNDLRDGSIIDFMILDAERTKQFLTLEEVLIPAIRTLNPERRRVQLTDVCKVPSVIDYFRKTIRSIWNFSDFEIYFQAHWETFEYDAEKQSLRLRGDDEKLGFSLRRARKTDQISNLLSEAVGMTCERLPLDVVGHVLSILVGESDTPSPSAMTPLLQILSIFGRVCGNDEAVTFGKLLPLCDRLSALRSRFRGSEGLKDLREALAGALDAAARRVTRKLVKGTDDSTLAFESLIYLLALPVDWNECASPLSQRAQKLIAMRPLEDLVPLLKTAARVQAGAFGECLATTAMMKTFGASPEVAVTALDAMAAGGFAIDGVAMTLRMVLPRASSEAGAAVVASLLERGVVSADVEACWDTVSAAPAALPGAILLRLVASASACAASDKSTSGIAAAKRDVLMDELLRRVAKSDEDSAGLLSAVASLPERSCDAFAAVLSSRGSASKGVEGRLLRELRSSQSSRRRGSRG
eukprot:TRINITY_DN15448_c0_g1_i1.p1 TRINITY_DN15448_c0_g1~~TRINITY_DN15448_c0_g1_i1.p1  ORF type:complete len:796 (-),score=141.65 TRINITY_DN15448_c0_g1_i1:142-2529(-)